MVGNEQAEYLTTEGTQDHNNSLTCALHIDTTKMTKWYYRILAHITRALYDFLHKTATTARYTLTRVIRNFIYTHKISW